MPLLFLILALPLLVLVFIAALPLALVQRYRMGTMRRQARGWLATINLVGLLLSAMLFLVAAAVTNTWVPHAFLYTAAGLASGCVLGILGLVLSRWEAGRDALYYTPNRWLVLGITIVVTARVLYGLARTWRAWQAGLEYESWAAASGIAGSMAAGAVVLGYYIAYWIGVRRRVRHHRGRSGRGA